MTKLLKPSDFAASAWRYREKLAIQDILWVVLLFVLGFGWWFDHWWMHRSYIDQLNRATKADAVASNRYLPKLIEYQKQLDECRYKLSQSQVSNAQE